jgi:chemotaxis protein methyltransferase CheR
MLSSDFYRMASEEVESIKNMMLEKEGFDYKSYSDKFLRRRMKNRMNYLNLDSFAEYLDYLKENPLERSNFIDDISISVTDFFRDLEVWKDFENVVVPKLMKKKKERNQRMVRVWSVGCASGEETYSIAISMKEAMGQNFDNFNISIYGMDIDDVALKKAKSGTYSKKEVEGVPGKYLNKYFYKSGDSYEVKREIKRAVKFKKYDLTSDEELSGFDIIFCRNMLIYFSEEGHEEVHMKLYRALRDHGFLIIGKTELLHGKARDKLMRVTDNRIFRKPSSFFD